MATANITTFLAVGQHGIFHAWDEEVPNSRTFKTNGWIQTGDGFKRAVVIPTADHGMSVDVGETLADADGETPRVRYQDENDKWHTAREYGEPSTETPDADMDNANIVAVDPRRDGELPLAIATRMSQLPGLARDLAETCHLTGDGKPTLPHIDKSRPVWFRSAAQIRTRYSCTEDQATELADSFRVLDTTPTMAIQFDKWIKIKGIDAGLKYFSQLAGQLVLVTDEGDPILDLMVQESAQYEDDDIIKDELSAEPMPADVIHDHLLDDPRDADDIIRWEDRQPAIFKNTVKAIRTANPQGLAKIGKSLFDDKRFNKTQMSVLWDEYHRAKKRHQLAAPKLTKKALKAIERLTDPKTDLSRAAAWLYNEAPRTLRKDEVSTIWESFKAAKKARAPKQPRLIH